MKKPASLVNYEKEAKKVERRLQKIEKRWGGDLKIELKAPLPKPKTATEARKAQKFLDAHRLEKKLLELVKVYRIVDGNRVEFNPQEVADVYFQQTLIRNRRERERKAAQRKVKQIYGKEAVKMEPIEPVKIYPVSQKGLTKLKERSEFILANPTRTNSIMRSNFEKVLESYPMEFSVVVEHLMESMSDSELSVRLKALYAQEFQGKGSASMMWIQFWESKGTRPTSDRQMNQILRMMGASFDSAKIGAEYKRITGKNPGGFDL